MGKFIHAGGEKVYVRGVTYGAFRPDPEGNEYQDAETIERDFAQMAASGMNAVRIPHTTPPRSLLDIAQRHGLWVMVGLSAEQYVGLLIDGKESLADIEARLRDKVRTCAEHPALLCYALGNEIPAPIVRWLGRRRVERFLERMYRAVKAEDPDGLVSYVNYPTTEYLQLDFLDLLCFNVYLESRDRLDAYLARLQNIAGDRPLIMSELGLDARRNGELQQARVLDWQVRSAAAAGCAGVFIFSWTDEWYRGGEDVEDWKFGLTDRERRPKPALDSARAAFDAGIERTGTPWPRISVVVCTHNGSRTLRECCEGLGKLDYPDFEVIVVDDGSSDDSAAIARASGLRVISTPHRGLSSARNTGLEAASGEIVAYIDDDAYPDPQWLSYLALAFASSDHVGVGGPNLTPVDDGWISHCVAHAPGNPTHVLLTDAEAEHLPGCNMAFRKQALQAVGGFDARFRAAGDDVDVCWKLRERGWSLGFAPAATVWHHRRGSVRAFLRQQAGYGRAERDLQRKWMPGRGGLAALSWAGRIYGAGAPPLAGLRVYHGVWGHAPFQSIYGGTPGSLRSAPMTPDFQLVVLALACLSVVGALWPPLLVSLPLLAAALGLIGVHAISSARRGAFAAEPRSRLRRAAWLGVTAALTALQPVARLWGRLFADPPPRRLGRGLAWPRPRASWLWTERGREPEQWLESIEAGMRSFDPAVVRGGDFDAWDLALGGGELGGVRVCVAVEDHGAGRQMLRFRSWPQVSTGALLATAALLVLSGFAAWDQAWVASAALALGASALGIGMFVACGRATAACLRVFELCEHLDAPE